MDNFSNMSTDRKERPHSLELPSFDTASDMLLFPDLGFDTSSPSSDLNGENSFFDVSSGNSSSPQTDSPMTVLPTSSVVYGQTGPDLHQQQEYYASLPSMSAPHTSSSSASHSHQTSPQNAITQNPFEGEIECSLLHKPRRSKGAWQPVEVQDALRVTKGKGKWLKLEIKCRYPFDLTSMTIRLLHQPVTKALNGKDKAKEHTDDDDEVGEGFSIEMSKIFRNHNAYFGEVEIK